MSQEKEIRPIGPKDPVGDDTERGIKLKKKFDEIDSNIKELNCKCTELEKIKELNNVRFSALDTSINSHDNKIVIHSNEIDKHEKQIKEIDVYSKRLNNYFYECESKITEVKEYMKDAQRDHRLKERIYFSVIAIFNIVAIWLIIYNPDYSVVTKRSLPSYYSIILVAIMLANLFSALKFIMPIFIENLKEGAKFAPAEIVLFAFNTVAMWLFACHPLQEVTKVVTALFVFLMLANLTSIITRISMIYEQEMLGLIFMGIECFFLLIVLVIYIFWIRV